jgi:predicted nucleotidyltransferase
MPEKPRTAAGYPPGQVQQVKATCLYLATKLGDLMDELVVVGGLVPPLLIQQDELPPGVSAHVGTMDLDIGLAFAVIENQHYQALTERLRRAQFEPDTTEKGRPTRQRWRISSPPVTVDFLIEPEDATERAGKLFDIEKDFAAMIAPGLHLAFENRVKVKIDGETIAGEKTSREVWVCGAGAYVVLKALAFHIRGENKDAYDLYYLVRNYGSGVIEVANQLKPLLKDKSALLAMDYLKADFLEHNGLGPRRVAEFLYDRQDQETQADVVGFVRSLLEACGK